VAQEGETWGGAAMAGAFEFEVNEDIADPALVGTAE
jgi:hypothetical protein